ncbi:MAG: histidinol dehydrogenase [Cytophagaceae bacterium]|nr:histidinol dehydrogenase [Cytophagaceae bacterium]MDW8455543.1 histidinol dehydrogenase [Cytophagaceae bacterium]
MNYIEYPERDSWKSLCIRPSMNIYEIEQKVLPILKEVKTQGDEALYKFTLVFDKVSLSSLRVTDEELSSAYRAIPEILKRAINEAKKNIEKFHIAQKEEVKIIETTPGVTCWRNSVPIERVGLYIPGGSAPLFSTLLMLAVPSKIAGCEQIVLCTPPDDKGQIHPAILYTAHMLGIKHVYKLGGAQAIAAMAYGTATVPQVYKIFGPGNQYVTAAKQLVSREGVAIDMPAGPSEVAVLANNTSKPAFVAADLLSQAEHGADSQVILASDNKDVIHAIHEQIEKQSIALPRRHLVEKALQNSCSILFASLNEAMDFLNEYAPEHLIIAVDNFDQYAAQVKNAGSVFLGHYTPEAAGDYASGTNHTLPTYGFAKAYSGVSLDSFIKKITFQHISQEGIRMLGATIETMAEAEQLEAHKKAVRIRYDNK